MSAFVVEPITISKIVSALEFAKENRIYPARYPNPKYTSDLLIFDNPQKFGLAMYEMNIKAVMQRYDESNCDNLPGMYDENDHLVKFVYQSHLFMLPEPIDVFKALECYLYQCTEGNVPELPLYKALMSWRHDLAENIVHNLPQYENFHWG